MSPTPHVGGSNPDPSESTMATSEEAQQAIRTHAVEVLQDYAAKLCDEQQGAEEKLALTEQTYAEMVELLRNLPLDRPQDLDSLAEMTEQLSAAQFYSIDEDEAARGILSLQYGNPEQEGNFRFMFNSLIKIQTMGKVATRPSSDGESRVAHIRHFSLQPAEEVVQALREANLLTSY